MTIRIGITPGEPAGIGPDLAVMLAQQVQPYEVVVIGDPHMLHARPLIERWQCRPTARTTIPHTRSATRTERRPTLSS